MDAAPSSGPSASRESYLDPQVRRIIDDLKVLYQSEKDARGELEFALAELTNAYEQTAQALATMAEWKTDPRTAQHLERTKRYALALTQNIDPDLAGEPWLKIGFLLHDIGKAGIQEGILMKPGPLTPKERELVRTHPIIGAQWLEPIEFLAEAIPIVKQHHERWDGDGYPYGLRGEEIHIGARIFSIVDAFDAMTSDRPYRDAMTLDQALDEIKKGSGTQFDPEVVRVLSGMWPDLSEMHGAVHA